MNSATLDRLRTAATTALHEHLPRGCDDGWLTDLVDPPRFGWDRDALDRGFFDPLRDWAERHPARLRPVLAGLLMDALGDDGARHGALMAALELHYLAAIMLDDLRNGRDLSDSTAPEVALPLPVWVTVAYNARQLAPVLLARRGTSLPPPARTHLAGRFAALLLRQGLGSCLDLAASERGIAQPSAEHLAAHLRTYAGTLTFALPCEAAAVAAGLDAGAAARLAGAGADLGVSLRLAALARGEARAILTADGRLAEQRIRWFGDLDPGHLGETAAGLRQRALEAAHGVHPAAAQAFAGFLAALETPAGGAPA